jgi:transcriptional regulator with XRE-family HTH domain
MTYRNFGDAIRAKREARGWSREEIARRLGITLSGFSKMEHDPVRYLNVSRSTVERYAEALEVDPPDELLVVAGFAPHGNKPIVHVLDLASRWRLTQLRPEEVEFIEDQIAQMYTLAEKTGRLKK